MLPTSEAPGPFEQAGQHREHGRRIAAGRGRLAGREADLPLRHREPGEAVHEEQHVLARVAEGLGDAGRGERGAEPDEGGFVGGRDDHDRAGEALGTEVVLDELAHLTAALADQCEDGDRSFGTAGDHRQECRFSDAGTGEDAHTLTAPARHERVERADAERERFADHAAGQRVRGRVVDADVRHVVQRRSAVDGTAEPVEHTAEECGPDRDLGGAVGTLARGRRRVHPGARRAACTPDRPGAPRRPRRPPAPASPRMRTDAPIGRCSPSISRFRPTTRATRPWTLGLATSRRCSSSALDARTSRARSMAALTRASTRHEATSTMQSPGVRAGSGTIASTRPGASVEGSPSTAMSAGFRRAVMSPCVGASASARAIASRPRPSGCASSCPTSTSAICIAAATTWSSRSARAVVSRAANASASRPRRCTSWPSSSTWRCASSMPCA